MKTIYVLHGNREFISVQDKQHISRFTLVAMAQVVAKLCYIKNKSIGKSDKQFNTKLISTFDELSDLTTDDHKQSTSIIFLSGNTVNDEVIALANGCDRLAIVLEDPNWDVDLGWINRDYSLITWSASINDKYYNRRHLRLNANSFVQDNVPRWTIGQSPLHETHVPMSLIELLSINVNSLKTEHIESLNLRGDEPAPQKMFMNDGALSNKLLPFFNDRRSKVYNAGVYIGSLKIDRVADMIEACDLLQQEFNMPTDFYGNFTEQDMIAAYRAWLRDHNSDNNDKTEEKINERVNKAREILNNASFYGRISTSSVIGTLSQYSTILYIPDPAIISLELDTLRLIEMAIALRPGSNIVALDKGDAQSLKVKREIERIKDIRSCWMKIGPLMRQTPDHELNGLIMSTLVNPKFNQRRSNSAVYDSLFEAQSTARRVDVESKLNDILFADDDDDKTETVPLRFTE